MSATVFRWALLSLAALSSSLQATEYMSQDSFLAQVFSGPPTMATLWLNDSHQTAAKKMLGHRYKGLRVRYWRELDTTAWVLDEIGKEQPITIGVIISDDKIVQVDILAFRESRGWEVRHPFFTEQFRGLELDKREQLTGPIDGITGATLSVKAVTHVSRFALALHRSLKENQI